MSRTEIAIEPGPTSLMLKLAKGAPHAAPRGWLPLNLDPHAAPSLRGAAGTPVRTYGEFIRDQLYSHAGVKEAIRTALGTVAGQQAPIYFRLESEEVEQLFWESLCDTGGKFVALDARWPIGRIAEPSTHQASRFHPFEAPLRVMAFISAAGISGKLEFDALYAAIEKGRQKGLQILLEVLVGEEQLHDSIKAAIQANRIKNTSVYPIPDQGGVKDHILEFDPQILHFFCHGHTGHGVAQLELATFADWVAHSPSGSTVVRINDLEAMAASSDTDIWLITLNCCLGARPVDGLPSMARSLVTAGAPAVVGMAEPMAALDANEFTRQFYPEVLTTFASRLVNSPPGNSVNFEWAEMLYRARSALGSANARNTAKDREWAIPVLYTRPESFSVALVSDALRQKVETLAEWLRTLGPNTPDRIRDMIHQEMMPPNVPPSLRPDRFGNFPE